jgi:hypothetical protein
MQLRELGLKVLEKPEKGAEDMTVLTDEAIELLRAKPRVPGYHQ